MAIHHRLTFALTTLAVTLAGCGAPGLAPQQARLEGGFDAFAKSLSAKTISTPIGKITLTATSESDPTKSASATCTAIKR